MRKLLVLAVGLGLLLSTVSFAQSGKGGGHPHGGGKRGKKSGGTPK
jgi:hypothetical protein